MCVDEMIFPLGSSTWMGEGFIFIFSKKFCSFVSRDRKWPVQPVSARPVGMDEEGGGSVLGGGRT